jgi:hypothetical protein
MAASGSSCFHTSSANPPSTTSSSSITSPAANSTALLPLWYPPPPVHLLNILVWTVIHIVVAKFRTLGTRRRLTLPFLTVIVLAVVGGGMQPREQGLQDGGGNGSDGGGRIVVESDAILVVCLFVVVVVPLVDVLSLVIAALLSETRTRSYRRPTSCLTMLPLSKQRCRLRPRLCHPSLS